MAEPTRADQRAQQRIAQRLAQIGFALPGTLLVRSHVCGKPGCRCMAAPPRPHGPFHQWTRKIAGKTVTRRLTEDQIDRYRPWFDNARLARELLAELEALSLRIAERDQDLT